MIMGEIAQIEAIRRKLIFRFLAVFRTTGKVVVINPNDVYIMALSGASKCGSVGGRDHRPNFPGRWAGIFR